MRTFSFMDSIIDAFYCANWEPMTIAVPMNGDLITLTPTFMNGIKDESHMNGLKVEGAPLPLEGSIPFVVAQLKDYDKLIARRDEINSQVATLNA